MGANLSPLHHRLLQSILESGAGASLHSFGTVLHQYLFRLPHQIQTMTDLKLTQLKLQPRGFVTVHIRTGFKNSLLGEFVSSETFFKGERFARTKDLWRSMIDCAIRISDSRFGSNSTILVASDDKSQRSGQPPSTSPRSQCWTLTLFRANKPMLGVFRAKSKDVYLDTWVHLT